MIDDYDLSVKVTEVKDNLDLSNAEFLTNHLGYHARDKNTGVYIARIEPYATNADRAQELIEQIKKEDYGISVNVSFCEDGVFASIDNDKLITSADTFPQTICKLFLKFKASNHFKFKR